MRATTILIALALALLCFTSFVVADDAVAAAVDETPAADEKPNPWKPAKLTGLAIGENAALAVPVPILVIIFLAFLGAASYGVYLIFDSDKQRERKAEEAKAKRLAKEAKKGSKKK